MPVSRRTFLSTVAAGSAATAALPDRHRRATPPVPRATWSARSASDTRAGSPAPATAPRSAAGGTGAATGSSRRRRPTPPSCPGRTCATCSTAIRPPTRTSATASRPRCSPRTTSRPSTRTSAGCARTAWTPRRCSGSTRSATRARPATRWRRRSGSRRRGHRPQVLHHVRRHRLDNDAVRSSRPTGPPRCRRTPASPAYARQNGKPVVCIWGFGFNDDGRPFAPAPASR